MTFEDFLEKKMSEMNNSKKEYNKINKEFNDVNSNNHIKRINNRITLDNFSRNTFENSVNYYQKSIYGDPKALRLTTKGCIFKDSSGEIACKLVVEKRNNESYITEIFVDDKYKGFGLYKDLIKLAQTNFNSYSAIINKEDMFKMTLFKSNNYQVIGKEKDNYILSCNEDMLTPIGQPKNQLKAKASNTQFKQFTSSSSNSKDQNTDNSKGLNLSNISMKNNNFTKSQSYKDRDSIYGDNEKERNADNNFEPESGFIDR